MVESIGLDIVDMDRLARSWERFGDRLLQRVLTLAERERFARRRDALAYLAGRFAAKEATIKAMGAFVPPPVRLNEISVENRPDGSPLVRPPERLAELFARRRLHVSLSHSHSAAAAVVIVEQLEQVRSDAPANR